MTLNANLKEGEIKEEDIFSRMIQFAKAPRSFVEEKKKKKNGP